MTAFKALRIFGVEQELPVALSRELAQLGEQARQRSKLVRTGLRPKTGLWRLIGVRHDRLDPRARFAALQELVHGYEAILGHLERSQEAYDQFLRRLAEGLHQGIAERCERARDMEARRLALVRRAREKDNASLIQQVELSEERLNAAVRLLVHATLLVLEKLELGREAVQALARDQALRKRLVQDLVEDLQDQQELLALDRDLGQLGREGGQAKKRSMNFEEYLRERVEPLEGLLAQVSTVDGELLAAAREIQSLTEAMTTERYGALPELGDHQRIFDLLIAGDPQEGCLRDLLERAPRLGAKAGPSEPELAARDASVGQILANLEVLAAARLGAPTARRKPLDLIDDLLNPGLAVERERRREISASPFTAQVDTPITVDLTETIELRLVTVAAGELVMGSAEAEEGRRDDERLHQVRITRPFWLQSTPVTQGQFEAVMGYNPSHFRGLSFPVEMVRWYEALAFCNALSRREGLPEAYELKHPKLSPRGQLVGAMVSWEGPGCPGYRLPTEAEWEHALRGAEGSTEELIVDLVAWHNRNSGGAPHPVALREPNSLGLYDLLGNVWEWVWDRYGPYSAEPVQDPLGPGEGDQRVLRGGSWVCEPALCRASARSKWAPGKSNHNTGFRLARTIG